MSSKKIHLIGICGVAMGTLALMLREIGCRVRGSDKEMYPPMSDMLDLKGVEVCRGFDSANIGEAELVIVGNAISRGNPEVEYILDEGIPYMSMAQALQAFFLKGREVIAVCGTHGKSTTTALLAHILETAGMAPSFFVGGVSMNYDASYKIGSGRYFIIEGDEYDSAFFEKIPKFIIYRPCHIIATSLEFDHADIFTGIDEIELWFKRLINIIPSRGNIVYAAEYANLRDMAESSLSRHFSYGCDNAQLTYRVRERAGDITLLEFSGEGSSYTLETPLLGKFNYSNIAAAASMAMRLGVPAEYIRDGVRTFQGVKRRQELIYRRGNILIYEDFAHHPTSIGNVIGAMRDHYPDALIWAIYEPRSATSRRNVFQNELPGAFAMAHRIFIKTPFQGSPIAPGDMLDMERLQQDMADQGMTVAVLPSAGSILKQIAEEIDIDKKHVIIIMSNGAFDGIYEDIRILMDTLLAAGTPDSCQH